jgi:molybdopterin molybdotransferase
MDGYAVRFSDVRPGAEFTVIGEAAAGAPFARTVGANDAVRIFTGGAVPSGADHVVIQEEVRRAGDKITIIAPQEKPSNIREAGIDFRAGARLKRKGARLTSIDLGLIAAANVARVAAYRRPVVAYFDNGDELREPADALRHGEIVGSNRFVLDALIAEWGGEPHYLGRAGDDKLDIAQKFEAGRSADILIPVGGASVGDHDHVRAAFFDAGGDLVFSKIAVRPGKPTWFGKLGDARVLGLPGNPASAIVCSLLFVQPLIAASSGESFQSYRLCAASAQALKANGPRESYLRGRITAGSDARLMVEAFNNQDSSLFSPLTDGNCLIRRAANAAAVREGEIVECLPYAPLRQGV